MMDLSKQIERMAQDRDLFRDSYARKLVEHTETLLDCIQLCQERDEARAKLAASEAHVATLRECVSDAQKWAERWASHTEHRNPHAHESGPFNHHPSGYAVCPIPDWEVKQKRDDYAGALAATPAESLEAIRQSAIDATAREVAALLKEMGATSPPPGTLFLDGVRLAVEGLRAEAGRERAVRELRGADEIAGEVKA